MEAKIEGFSTGEDRRGRPLPGKVQFTLTVVVDDNTRLEEALRLAYVEKRPVRIRDLDLRPFGFEESDQQEDKR